MTAVDTTATTPGRRTATGRSWWRPDRAGTPIVLALVLLGGSVVFGDSFASGRNLGNIALDSSYLLLIATGMTFVILSGGIDLSVGSLLALSGVLTAYGAQWGTLTAVLLPLAVCGVLGLINGLLIGTGSHRSSSRSPPCSSPAVWPSPSPTRATGCTSSRPTWP
jgi:ribose/xylose/arabinose/galactoside ABC-type transport system permease subunit